MSDLRIFILGPGCEQCDQLEANVRQAAEELGYVAQIEHVREPGRIATFGVIRTPALVLNRDVLSQGRVVSVGELKDLISGTRGALTHA